MNSAIPVADLLAAAYAAADWAPVSGMVGQSLRFRASRPSRPIPDDLRDALAERLVSVAASYPGRYELFAVHAFAVFADAMGRESLDGHLFQQLYSDRRRTGRPALFETVVETARRLRELDAVRKLLSGVSTTGIPCGSVCYGPFYNVRATSDLDLILVVDDLAELPALVERIAMLHGPDAGSVQRLRARAAIFAARYDDGQTVFSHKLSLWADEPDPMPMGAGSAGGYHLSLHVLNRWTLSYVLVESSTTLSRTTAGRSRTVRDYRDTMTTRPDRPRTFAGREYRTGARLRQAELGWLRPVTVYQFDDADSYCPGFFQTILLPGFDPLWDDLDVRRRLRVFRQKYFDRFRVELARDPHAYLAPSLTHVRRERFAPHVVADFDRGAR